MSEHRAECGKILPTTTTTDHDTVHAALSPIRGRTIRTGSIGKPADSANLLTFAIGSSFCVVGCGHPVRLRRQKAPWSRVRVSRCTG
jgi:hypothetical protein